MTTIPTLTLNNGVTVPALGFGVFQTPPEETVTAVQSAWRPATGTSTPRPPTATSAEVGEAIRRSGVDRDDVFIETKVWISDYGYDATLHAFDKSAGKLGVDQIDLFILHQALPAPSTDARGVPGAGDAARRRQGPRDRRQQLHARAPRVAAGSDRTSFRRSTRSRCIRTSPSPQCSAADAEHGILTQAWSPIGGITSYRGDGPNAAPSNDPVITEIGAAHGKSAAQVMLRWHLQQGRSAIPKSVRPRGSRRTSTCSTSSCPPRSSPPSTRLDTGERGGPEPESITLEAFGRPIPEA